MLVIRCYDRSTSSGGGSGSKVVELTESSFEKAVLGSDDLWIVAFTAPWCGHCKNLVPQFATASVDAAGKAKFGNVDSTEQQGTASSTTVLDHFAIISILYLVPYGSDSDRCLHSDVIRVSRE